MATKQVGANRTGVRAQAARLAAREQKPPLPTHCRVYARAELAKALPAVLPKLLDKAKTGSLPHLRLLMQLAGLDKGAVEPPVRKRGGKSLQRILQEAWAQGPDDWARGAGRNINSEEDG